MCWSRPQTHPQKTRELMHTLIDCSDNIHSSTKASVKTKCWMRKNAESHLYWGRSFRLARSWPVKAAFLSFAPKLTQPRRYLKRLFWDSLIALFSVICIAMITHHRQLISLYSPMPIRLISHMFPVYVLWSNRKTNFVILAYVRAYTYMNITQI